MGKIFNEIDYIEICRIFHSITKIDTRLINLEGKLIFKSGNISILPALEQPNVEYLFLYQHLKQYPPLSYYHYMDAFRLEYIAVGIWKSESFFGTILVGPFISRVEVFDMIKDIIIENNIPISERKHLEEYYQSLPALTETEYEHMGALLVNICSNGFKPTQKISNNSEKILLNQKQKTKIIEDNKIIEERYKNEKILMDTISKGDQEKVDEFFQSQKRLRDTHSNRILGNPLRSYKNFAIIRNTLFRIAAERGGVHPVYLDNISERFAILIERSSDFKSLSKLSSIMTNEYCNLVKTFSTGQYSPLIKKAINYIQFNLEQPLSLNTIAKEIQVNPSLLSRKFKEETGMNFTGFINQKRINEAKLYLQRGEHSITDIAFMVGFNDLNYFSKVFKKFTALTPSEYREMKK